MAQTPEGRVKARTKKVLEELECWFFMPPANGYGRAGIPDFIGCLNGVFFAIETKAGKNKPTALQIRELERIQAAGGYAIVVNEENVDDLKPLLLKQMRKEWIL